MRDFVITGRGSKNPFSLASSNAFFLVERIDFVYSSYETSRRGPRSDRRDFVSLRNISPPFETGSFSVERFNEFFIRCKNSEMKNTCPQIGARIVNQIDCFNITFIPDRPLLNLLPPLLNSDRRTRDISLLPELTRY